MYPKDTFAPTAPAIARTGEGAVAPAAPWFRHPRAATHIF